MLSGSQRYKWMDMAKFLFACLISFLHVEFGKNAAIEFVGQYMSRLGVPFFFAFSGMMLSFSIEHRGGSVALKRFLKRIAKLLIVWLLIDTYYLWINYSRWDGLRLVQLFLFKTPAFLWFLTSLLVAAVPFCLIKKERHFYLLALLFFAIGMVLSESYSWLFGEFAGYKRIFLTSRNGLLFAFPMMCVGRWAGKRCFPRSDGIGLFVASVLLFAEITLVGHKATPNADRSMYFMLPFAMYFLLVALKRLDRIREIRFDTRFFSDASLAIYLSQILFIDTMNIYLIHTGINRHLLAWLTYIAILIVPSAVVLFLRRLRKKDCSR